MSSHDSLSRRTFLSTTALAAVSAYADGAPLGGGQNGSDAQVRTVETDALRIAYEEHGPADGVPVVLLHGFPDDVRAYDRVVPPLVAAGHRVLVPYLRGHGPTRFRRADAPRMAQQAAIGQDVIDFADALHLPAFAVAGYDWGGRAAAIAAALHPARVRAAVLIGGYTVQNTTAAGPPPSPEAAYRTWYQWYFNTEPGRAGLAAHRRPLCRMLWRQWSPSWQFTDAEYERTAPSFDNPDFVEVVVHSYRHRHRHAPGEPAFDEVERQLAARPAIPAPTITLYGADDGIVRPSNEVPPRERAVLPALVARRVVDGVGHFMPRERPDAVAQALLELLQRRG